MFMKCIAKTLPQFLIVSKSHGIASGCVHIYLGAACAAIELISFNASVSLSSIMQSKWSADEREHSLMT